MEVLYSLVFIFTMDGTRFSESSEHFLPKSKYVKMGHGLTKRMLNHLPCLTRYYLVRRIRRHARQLSNRVILMEQKRTNLS
jgi:hypothetical protein